MNGETQEVCFSIIIWVL